MMLHCREGVPERMRGIAVAPMLLLRAAAAAVSVRRKQRRQLQLDEEIMSVSKGGPCQVVMAAEGSQCETAPEGLLLAGFAEMPGVESTPRPTAASAALTSAGAVTGVVAAAVVAGVVAGVAAGVAVATAPRVVPPPSIRATHQTQLLYGLTADALGLDAEERGEWLGLEAYEVALGRWGRKGRG